MKLPFQMTCAMFVPREFRTEIDCCSTTLPIKSEHRELVGSQVNVGVDCEIPTAAHSGYVNVILSGLAQRREIGCPQVIACVGVVYCRAQLSLERDAVVD